MKTRSCVLVILMSLLLAGCSPTVLDRNRPSAVSAGDCITPSEQEIASLFDRWNLSLQSGNPQKVVANYAEQSILLPTVSNTPRLTPEEKVDYFHHFLKDRPTGEITLRQIQCGCNMAVDSGLYTFTFARTGNRVTARYSFTYRWDGRQWLIVSHHSSGMPEK